MILKREFVEVKTYKYDLSGRVTKKTKHVVEAVDDGEGGSEGGEGAENLHVIGFQYEPDTEEDICEEDE